MNLENNADLIIEAIKSYIKELSTTKKGKYSYRKYNKNKVTIFAAFSLAVDIETERNKDKIEESIVNYINQFADIKDINLGDRCEFDIKKTAFKFDKESLMRKVNLWNKMKQIFK